MASRQEKIAMILLIGGIISLFVSGTYSPGSETYSEYIAECMKKGDYGWNEDFQCIEERESAVDVYRAKMLISTIIVILGLGLYLSSKN